MKIINLLIASFSITLAAMMMAGCQNEEPTIQIGKDNTLNISFEKRTPEEAISVATDAYNSIYGTDNSSSRSIGELIDYSTPVRIVSSGKHSRSVNTTDTCIYVVNFANDGGFAIVAADRNINPLLGISDCGHFDPEKGSDNPGLRIFMNNAIIYASEGPDNRPTSLSDTAIRIEDDKVEVKEWEDSVFSIKIDRRVNNAWGQGVANMNSLEQYPEGYYFSNGLCGCGPLAIAQSLLFFSYPATIPATTDTQAFSPNWEIIKLHLKYKSEMRVQTCTASERVCHEQIARLCRAIGNLAGATVDENGTGTTSNGIRTAISRLGYNITSWTQMSINTHLPNNTPAILILIGNDQASGLGHCWILDGEKMFTAYHYFATRKALESWNTTLTSTYSGNLVHFNWGWDGTGNGWYSRDVFVPRSSSSAHQYNFINVRFAQMYR